VTKICDKTKEVQAENCTAAAEVRRPYLSRHIKFKKEKNINYYYNYTTILSGERYLAKNAKKQVRFLHTKHSTNYLCLKKLKKKSLKMSMKTEE